MKNIFLIPEITLEDALYTGHTPGLYKVNDQTANNPSHSYGVAIILKNANSGWIFVIIIPTNLTTIYVDFYNGYTPGAGWSGWHRADLVS